MKLLFESRTYKPDTFSLTVSAYLAYAIGLMPLEHYSIRSPYLPLPFRADINKGNVMGQHTLPQKDSPHVIHALHDCYSACLEGFSLHCAKKGGAHMAREHIRRLMCCSDMCALTADFLLRHSPFADELCDLCADVCKQCATSCRGLNDTEMNRCARICEEAAKACLDESHHLKSIAA